MVSPYGQFHPTIVTDHDDHEGAHSIGKDGHNERDDNKDASLQIAGIG